MVKIIFTKEEGINISSKTVEKMRKNRDSNQYYNSLPINNKELSSKKAFMSYFQIFLIIMSLFALGNIINGIDLIEAQAHEGNVCCEQTTDGQTCQNTDGENCDPNYKKSLSQCQGTDYCQIGCCISPDIGTCNEKTSRRDCNLRNGTFVNSEFCNVQECVQGCCILGDQNIWTTERNCEYEGNTQHPDLPTVWRFDENFNGELACLFAAEKDIEGACLFDSDGENKCIHTTLEDCYSRTGNENNFNRESFCSNPDLNTSCIAKDHKECITGEEDVYWYDSCDNKEDVAEDCDLFEGK
jgi:hypothetical protein